MGGEGGRRKCEGNGGNGIILLAQCTERHCSSVLDRKVRLSHFRLVTGLESG